MENKNIQKTTAEESSVCVKACTEKLGLDALGKLSIRDFNRLRNTVRGFLSRKE